MVLKQPNLAQCSPTSKVKYPSLITILRPSGQERPPKNDVVVGMFYHIKNHKVHRHIKVAHLIETSPKYPKDTQQNGPLIQGKY